MPFRDDDRAQSIQIGAVLLFAVLIILFATYQAFIVPNQNREVEANHVGTVTQQMQELRNAVVSMPSTAASRSITLTLGVEYPSRVVALNPPTPTGAIRTLGTDDGTVNLTIANAVATDTEVGDQWTGENHTFTTGGIAYVPGYNEYQNPPTIVYENSLLYHAFRSGNLTRAGQQIIDGRELTLLTLNGTLDLATSDSVAVDVQAVSASDRRIAVTNETGEALTVTVASRLNASQWESELRETGEFVGQGGHVVDVTEAPIPNSAFDRIQITLEGDETYVLRMAKAGVGTGVADETVAYLTDVQGDGESVPSGQTTRLIVEARDRYNNPVSGVQVNGSVGSGSLSSQSLVTDESGQAEFEYQAPRGTSGQVAANFSYVTDPGTTFDDSTPANVTIRLSVEGAGGTSGSLIYDGNAQAHDGPDANTVPGGVNVTVENTHGSTVTITDVELKPEDSTIDVLADRLGGSGIARHEIYVDADVSDGFTDFSQLTFDDGSSDGTTVPREVNLNSDARANNGDPQLSSGSTATIYLYEFFTDTNDASNVDMTGETLDLVVSYRLATGQAFQTQYTITPTAGGGGTSAPAASIDAITDQSTDCNRNPGGNCVGGSTPTAEFQVDYSASDVDGDLTQLDVELIEPDGNVVDSATTTYNNVASASETETLTHDPSDHWNGDYTIRVTATDGSGNTDVVTQTETADGT